MLEGSGNIYASILAEAKRQDGDLVLTTFGQAVPGGRVSKEAFEMISRDMPETGAKG